MKICEICGAEELFEDDEALDMEDTILGVCEKCMQDFQQIQG